MIRIHSDSFFCGFNNLFKTQFLKSSHLVYNPGFYFRNRPSIKEIQLLRHIIFIFSTVFDSRSISYKIHYRNNDILTSPKLINNMALIPFYSELAGGSPHHFTRNWLAVVRTANLSIWNQMLHPESLQCNYRIFYELCSFRDEKSFTVPT